MYQVMSRLEQINFLNKILLAEMPEYMELSQEFPPTAKGQRQLLRALMNMRLPHTIGNDFLTVQDALLRYESEKKGIVHWDSLPTMVDECGGGFFDNKSKQIILWQGDITRLDVDAIVNAANSWLLGCFVPGHTCIDNAIHSAAGLELREACAKIMREQGHEESTGQAKITPAFNLPSSYVLHTVGPILKEGSMPTARDADELVGCYRSCLDLAEKHSLGSVAFCCISTGEFHYPNHLAAELAIGTVREWLAETSSKITVIFNVFKDIDAIIYRDLLSGKL